MKHLNQVFTTNCQILKILITKNKIIISFFHEITEISPQQSLHNVKTITYFIEKVRYTVKNNVHFRSS